MHGREKERDELMGYRSDVVLAVALPTNHADTLIAAYMIQPGVQEHNCLKDWHKDVHGDKTILWVGFNDVKWYEGYEDVKAYERMESLCQDLAEAPGSTFLAASIFLRIGENEDDMERATHTYTQESNDDVGYDLLEALEERFAIRRELLVDAGGEPLVGDKE
jgi:hypothetical protein